MFRRTVYAEKFHLTFDHLSLHSCTATRVLRELSLEYEDSVKPYRGFSPEIREKLGELPEIARLLPKAKDAGMQGEAERMFGVMRARSVVIVALAIQATWNILAARWPYGCNKSWSYENWVASASW